MADPVAIGRVFDALHNWADLAERPWNIALLIALDDGPTTSVAACAAALAWAQGQLPEADLPASMVELVESGLAVHLSGQGDGALFVTSTAGLQVLDRFDGANQQLRLLYQLADLAGTCVLHGRILQLTPTEAQILPLVVHGHTDQHIADLLFLSRRATQAHVRRILRKLRMRSRNALIARLTIEPIQL